MAREWLREFSLLLPASTVLVFEDSYVADVCSEFHTLLACCLEELPETCRIIVISREAAPRVLKEFNHRRMVHELTWDDLKVTAEEALGIAGFILEKVDARTVRQFHAKTNGWMAGLLLCLRHGDPPTPLLAGPAAGAATDIEPPLLAIHTLGRFELFLEGAPLTFSGKPPRRQLEMLKILLASGGRNVPTGSVIERLWPDAEGDVAADALATMIKRVRRLLGSEKIIRVQHGELTLDRRLVRVDAWQFEEYLAGSREALCEGDEVRSEHLVRLALALYRGHFLPGDSDKPWSFAYRERLRGKFLQHAMTLCRRLGERDETMDAIACYRDGLEIDYFSEEFYQQLMLCYYRTGLCAEAVVVYQNCRKNLAIHLGIALSPQTEEIYRLIVDQKMK
jgi:DNA-binding SARP family transcriptional activator